MTEKSDLMPQENMGVKKPFLQDVLQTDLFQKGQANIIVAPCHSGKTTAAVNAIAALASSPDRVLFLIDTTAGKDALTSRDDMERATYDWVLDCMLGELGCDESSKVRVMSYHEFGKKLLEYPGFRREIEIIICDEMHNLINWRNIEKSTVAEAWGIEPCKKALEEIMKCASKKDGVPLVVVMTATVNKVSKVLDRANVPMEFFDYTEKVHSDQTKKRVYYSDLLGNIDEMIGTEKALVYVGSITQMKKVAEELDTGWRNICCLWGMNNEEHSMSEEQLRIRKAILNNQRIPDDIDVLLINAAYETSINILNEDYNLIIIHSSDPDVQIQVRGRLRHDIDVLYLYDKNHQNVSHYFPEEDYDRFLLVAECREIAEKMNLTDEKGHHLKWPSVTRMLQRDGIQVSNVKQNGKYGYIVHKSA